MKNEGLITKLLKARIWDNMKNKIKFINKLKRKLFAKNKKHVKSERSRLGKYHQDVKEEWGDREKTSSSNNKNSKKEEKYFNFNNKNKKQKKAKKTNSKLKYFFIGSFLFFIISLGAGVFFLTMGSNSVSSKNVKIAISGPPEIRGGKNTTIQISVTNQNNSALELVDMVIHYPEGTISKEQGKPLPQKERRGLGDMVPGETVMEKVRAVFFGEKNEEKELKVEVEYRMEGSNAIFSSENKYPLVMESSPLSVSVKGQNEAVSGKEISFSVLVSSNSDTTIENAALKVSYPFGFTFSSSNLEPSSFDKSFWRLGDIPSGGKKKIKIKGILKGQKSEERIFGINIGIAKEEDEMKTMLARKKLNLLIKKPFLGTELTVNGKKNSPFKVTGGQRVRVDISWKNNTDFKILNAEIGASLSGEVLDKKSLSVINGVYNSSENRVFWSSATNKQMSEIKPEEEGNLNFTFDVKSLSGDKTIKNPKVDIDLGISGKRVESGESVPESVSSVNSKEILVASLFELVPRALYYSGPFENNGPIPPEVGEETTYTIDWIATNSSNNLKETTISAFLPSYVEWVDKVAPNLADIEYNTAGGVIEWNIGALESGEKKEVAFKVRLKPSLSQIGDRPIIIRNQQIKAFDEFSEMDIEKKYGSLNTDLSTEINFGRSDGSVIE